MNDFGGSKAITELAAPQAVAGVYVVHGTYFIEGGAVLSEETPEFKLWRVRAEKLTLTLNPTCVESRE